MRFLGKIRIPGAIAIHNDGILPAIGHPIAIPVAVRVRSIPDIVEVDAVHVGRGIARMRRGSRDEHVIAVLGGRLKGREAGRRVDRRPGSLINNQVV